MLHATCQLRLSNRQRVRYCFALTSDAQSVVSRYSRLPGHFRATTVCQHQISSTGKEELKTHLIEHRLGLFSSRKGKFGLLLVILVRQAVNLPQNRVLLEKGQRHRNFLNLLASRPHLRSSIASSSPLLLALRFSPSPAVAFSLFQA